MVKLSSHIEHLFLFIFLSFNILICDLSAGYCFTQGFSCYDSKNFSIRSIPKHKFESSKLNFDSNGHISKDRYNNGSKTSFSTKLFRTALKGWEQEENGEWFWKEETVSSEGTTTESNNVATVNQITQVKDRATPQIPSGKFRPKQSLGQNFLRDGNTVGKIVRYFAHDAIDTIRSETKEWEQPGIRPIELGPGPGALTGTLVEMFGEDKLSCIEIDGRAVELLNEQFPSLRIAHQDVLQVDYPSLSLDEGGPLSVIGNLPYYITSQILFALADASHFGAVRSATVTMQWEVAQRIIAPTRCKDYGILSVVFQLYADCEVHFKIPPTVFYPQPKVDSALVGIRFVGPAILRQRLAGVNPKDLRTLLAAIYQQRRKTVRNGLKKLVIQLHGPEKGKEILNGPPRPLPRSVIKMQELRDAFALTQKLPENWASLRPEELSPGQTVELTRLVFDYDIDDEGSSSAIPWDKKVWRKLNHGSN